MSEKLKKWLIDEGDVRGEVDEMMRCMKVKGVKVLLVRYEMS